MCKNKWHYFPNAYSSESDGSVVSRLLLGTFEVDEFSFGYLDYQMVVGEKSYLMNDSMIHCGPTHSLF